MTEKRKKRRQFGTVLLRRNPSGKAQTWIGRYTYKGIRCQRSFGKDGRIQAQSWLEEESSSWTLEGTRTTQINPGKSHETKRRRLSSHRDESFHPAHSIGPGTRIMANPTSGRQNIKNAIRCDARIHADRGLPVCSGRRRGRRFSETRSPRCECHSFFAWAVGHVDGTRVMAMGTRPSDVPRPRTEPLQGSHPRVQPGRPASPSHILVP